MTDKKTSDAKSKSFQAELLEMIKDPAAKGDRLFVAFVSIGLAIVALIIARWFWFVISNEPDRPAVPFIGLLATVALVAAACIALVSAVLLIIRKTPAASLLNVASGIGFFAGVAVAINSVAYFARNGNLSGVRDAFESFADFNRIEIGPIGFSITGTIMIIVIAAWISRSIRNR